MIRKQLERDVQIAELRLSGKSMKEIGNIVGTSAATVCRTLKSDLCMDILDRGAKILIAAAPGAARNVVKLAYTAKNEAVRLKANSTILKVSGIEPSHTSAPVIQNIYNDNRDQSNRIQINAIGRVLDANLGLDAPDDEDIIDAESDE